MDIKISTYRDRKMQAQHVKALYDDAGWWDERGLTEIEEMVTNVPAVGAWKGDTLVGFARAVTDGKFRAYIEDVVIHHSFQKEGIGQKLVATLLEELSHIDVISLFCEEDLIRFYEKNRFKYSKSQFVMHRKRPMA